MENLCDLLLIHVSLGVLARKPVPSKAEDCELVRRYDAYQHIPRSGNLIDLR